MSRHTSARRQKLAETARETIAVLPTILPALKNLNTTESELLSLAQLAPLITASHSEAITSKDGEAATKQSSKAPQSAAGLSEVEPNISRKTVRVRVVNADTFDTAIAISDATSDSNDPKRAGQTSRVAALNLASEKNPGGGWRSGALAQEECLCFRSSLYLSLHKSFYPIAPRSGLYSPNVVIIRNGYAEGHKLLVPETKPEDLPVVSIISVAAIRRPQKRTLNPADGSYEVYADPADLELMKDKMRLTLRIAAHKGHTKIVLGALGCGAFMNPVGEVAKAWVQVLKEPEFSGGLWEEVVFAVLDKGADPGNARAHEGNFNTFHSHLDGLEV